MELSPAEQARRFAAEHVAPRADLHRAETFPDDLWAAMGRAGLLGLYLPREYGGAGGDSAALMRAGAAFVEAGGNLGLAAAWFSHSVVARFLVHRCGSAAQRTRWLPELAAGRLTASVAISEPEAGAHPKHLAAEAEALPEGGWRLTGEKAWVTNGNIAGLFVVVAITAREAGRKRFSAFLVPREAPGLSLAPMPALEVLRPSQHVRVALKDVCVAADALLGELHTAFDTMAKPLRDVEDVLKTGRLLGGLRYLQARLLPRAVAAGEAAGDLLERAGSLEARLTALEALGDRAAAVLDEGGDLAPLEPLGLAIRELAAGLHGDLAALGAELGEEAEPWAQMARELDRSVNTARRVDAIKRRKLAEHRLFEGTSR